MLAPRMDLREVPFGFDPHTARRLDRKVPAYIAAVHAAGAGVAVIRNFQVVWTRYYGEQGPGVPAGRKTLFNTASLAKTITSENRLRLSARGKVSLNEPTLASLSPPGLAADPRHEMLTPRAILSHRSGKLNWPYLYPDGSLAFVATPGTTFGDSGAAFEILGGGIDSGKRALASFSPNRRGDAAIVLINGGGGITALLDIVDRIDPEQKITAFYRQLLARHQRQKKLAPWRRRAAPGRPGWSGRRSGRAGSLCR